MSHEYESGFVVRQPAWHGLAPVLDEWPGSWESAAAAADLDWDITTRPVYIAGEHSSDLQGAEDWQAVVRTDTAAILDIAPTSYRPITNADFGEVIETVMEGATGVTPRFETLVSLKGGRLIAATMDLGHIEIVGDPSPLRQYVVFYTSHDRSAALRCGACSVRIVCHEVDTPMLHKGEWIPVQDHPGVMGTRVENGLAVSIEGMPTPEVVTLDHKYWAKLPGQEPGWVMAKDLMKGRHQIGYPISEGELEPLNPLDLPEAELDDFWWLVGQWWADGHVSHERAITWTVSKPEIEARVLAILQRWGFRGNGSIRPGCRQITWSNARLADFLSSWRHGDGKGKGARLKVPPAPVEGLALPHLQSLVSGYYEGDGSWDKNRGGQIWTSTSLGGLLSLRRMLMRLGRPALIRRARPGQRIDVIEGREVRGAASWSLRSPVGPSVIEIADGWVWSPVKLVEWAGQREFVPLDTEGHIYTTAFGRSHNCANTQRAAENELDRTHSGYTIRHTASWKDRVEEVKTGMLAALGSHEAYRKLADQLAVSSVSDGDVNEFVEAWLPYSTDMTERQMNFLMARREAFLRLYHESVTTDGVRGTKWGIYQSAVELCDHYIPARSVDTLVKRQLITGDPLKTKALQAVSRL